MGRVGIRFLGVALALAATGCSREEGGDGQVGYAPPAATQCVPGVSIPGCTCTQVNVGVQVGAGANVGVYVCCDRSGCRAVGNGVGGY